MKSIYEVIAERRNDLTLAEDEVVNDADGLIYCAKCGTRRQGRYPLGTGVIEPRILCRCQAEERQREQAAFAQRMFQERVSRMKAAGLQDKKLHDYRFEQDKGFNPEIRHAHTYIARWQEIKKSGAGLLIWGDVGTGKSFFAGCIANALLEQGIPVMMTNFSRILNTLSGSGFADRNAYIDSLNQYDLLIIDDLGVERSSEFAQEQVFSVIDSRYRSRKPLIVTTNLTLEEIKNPPDLARARIYNRILERCIPIRINNQDIRQLNAAENLEKARKLFV